MPTHPSADPGAMLRRMALSLQAQQLLEILTAPGADPDLTMAQLVPFGPDREYLIANHQAVVDELRADGWQIRVDVERRADGEYYAVGFVPGQPRRIDSPEG